MNYAYNQSNLMSLIGKKILVIGGNGYVGNYFAAKLLQQSAIVSAMSRYKVDNIVKESNTISQRIEGLIGL